MPTDEIPPFRSSESRQLEGTSKQADIDYKQEERGFMSTRTGRRSRISAKDYTGGVNCQLLRIQPHEDVWGRKPGDRIGGGGGDPHDPTPMSESDATESADTSGVCLQMLPNSSPPWGDDIIFWFR